MFDMLRFKKHFHLYKKKQQPPLSRKTKKEKLIRKILR